MTIMYVAASLDYSLAYTSQSSGNTGGGLGQDDTYGGSGRTGGANYGV
jgi:hypothetical protein